MLIKLFWLRQGSEYAWSSFMLEKLLKMTLILNKPRFCIWHSCICKSYIEFWIYLIMASYASIIPQYALCLTLCQNMAEYCWMSLNMPEKTVLWVLNMPWYSYENIITVNNVIILEFLSVQFAYPSTLLLFHIFLTQVRT